MVVDSQREDRLVVACDRHVRSRHALEKAAHIHDQVADNRKVAQRIEAQRSVCIPPIPYLGHTRDAGKLFDAINPQTARTAGGMMAGAAGAEAVALSPFCVA